MTSPYLTRERATDHDADERTADVSTSRSDDRVFAQPTMAPAPVYSQPVYAQPAYAQQAPAPIFVQSGGNQGDSKAAQLGMALLCLIVVAIAAVAGFAFSRDVAPSAMEMDRYQGLAAREGAFEGRDVGYLQGRARGIAERRNIALLQGKIARAQAYNRAYMQGRRQMANAYNRRRSYGGYGGYYRRPSYGGYAGGAVSSALSQAQSLANATGQPVDVEIY